MRPKSSKCDTFLCYLYANDCDNLGVHLRHCGEWMTMASSSFATFSVTSAVAAATQQTDSDGEHFKEFSRDAVQSKASFVGALRSCISHILMTTILLAVFGVIWKPQ